VTERERVRAFLRETEEATCDAAVPARHGTALTTPSLPLVWQLNALRVEDPDAGAGAVAAEAEELQSHLGHRKLVVPDPEQGARLAPELARLGWNVGRLVVMVRTREPATDRSPDGGAEVDRAAGAAALAAFRREQPLDSGAESIRQLHEMDERYTRAAAARDFVAPPGEAWASCRLLSGRGLAEVDQVGTLSAHRRRGHASAAVLAAVRAARAEALDPVFLITDAGDWPQYLYRRLGFDHFDRRWEFLKLPLSASPT
jgi:ribosomal protein S18 acetylase RimI-like enzyme